MLPLSLCFHGIVATIGGGCGAGAVILTLFTTKGGLCCADQNAGPAAWEGPLGPREAINIFSIQLYDQPFLLPIPTPGLLFKVRFIEKLAAFLKHFSFLFFNVVLDTFN
jgi:hypothetical protein